MKFKLLIILKFLICLPQFSNEQVISFSMRKIAYSTNQFGLDLLRASNKNDDSKLVFCPFCISSSLVMLLMGSQGEMSNALRHTLYLYGLSENEINFAYFDMMNHLGVNLPTQKQSTNNLNFKTPANTGSGGSALNLFPNNLDPLNKANLLSSESQTLTLLPNNYLPTETFGQRNDASANSFKTSFDNGNQLFQPYDFIDRNKLVHPFSPFNENQHRNNFIKFSANAFDRFPTPINSDLNSDIKTSNYLFGRFIESSRRASRAFGFKNGFWNSKSYLNPFGTMLNAFQNNYQTHYPSNYNQNNLQPNDMIEKFGQSINHQALNNINNNIKLPNNFHYYNKHLSSKPNQDQQRNQSTTPNQASTNRKQTSPTLISSPLTTTTESPKFHSTQSLNPNNHHHSFNHPHYNNIKEHLPNLDNTIINHHSIRLGNTNVDLLNQHNTDSEIGNDISFLSNIYVQRDFVINYHYHLLLQKFYKTAIHPLDFIHNGEETRQHINAIVQMQTDNKICNILPERQSPSTQLLLISALYFKGELDLKLNLTKGKSSSIGDLNRLGNLNQISSGNQNNSNIYHHQHNLTNINKEQLSRNQEINDVISDIHNHQEEIWMEASRTKLRYAFDKYLNCSTIEMPFKDSMITLVIMIPNDINGLNTLLTKLNAQMLNDVINSLEIKRITIKLPRINIENSFRNLSMALANLGLSDLFRPGHSQLTNISDFRWLYVSDIIHKTHLNIKESSVNNQEIISSKQRGKQDDQTDVINIELNKPFIFFIMDSVSGLIMSMGIDTTKTEK